MASSSAASLLQYCVPVSSVLQLIPDSVIVSAPSLQYCRPLLQAPASLQDMPNSVNEYFAEKVFFFVKNVFLLKVYSQNILRAWLCSRVPGLLVKQTEALLITLVTVICIPLGPGPGQTPDPGGFYYRGFVFWAVVGYKLRLILWQFLVRIFGEKSSTWKYLLFCWISLLLYIKHKR